MLFAPGLDPGHGGFNGGFFFIRSLVLSLCALQQFLLFTFAFFVFLFLAFQAILAKLMPFAGDIGFLLVALLGPDFGLGKTVILHQRKMTGADVGATAAFNAIEQMIILHPIEIFGAGIPVKLLG